MADIGIDDVRHVAMLARIAFSDEELAEMTRELKSIVSWVDKLRELDTEGVSPHAHVLSDPARLRRDEVRPSEAPTKWLENAPAESGGTFRVPRVVE